MSLGRETELSNSFFVNEQKVHAIADPTHLIKSMKTAWLKFNFVLSEEVQKEFKLPSRVVSIAAVLALMDYDNGTPGDFKYAPHLQNDMILSKNSFVAMRVQPAMR